MIPRECTDPQVVETPSTSTPLRHCLWFRSPILQISGTANRIEGVLSPTLDQWQGAGHVANIALGQQSRRELPLGATARPDRRREQ